MFGFGEHSTIFSYVPKNNQNVLVIISSQHYDDFIDQPSGQATKPNMITYYNKTKSGVDVVHKLCASYNVASNTRRWPMVTFFSMLNIVGINAHVILFRNGQENIRRCLYLLKLGHELALPQLQQRSLTTQGIPRSLFEADLGQQCPMKKLD
ncbi:uncharacterized protein [Diabrotica undecimpunctata]|uniref:uncharacterized protein n=1 Tax=Diabrotica undecimpunctata TaxID=50387 RepID=UPI003B63A3FB